MCTLHLPDCFADALVVHYLQYTAHFPAAVTTKLQSAATQLNEHPWASAHKGKWGQLTPLEKWMKNKKAKTCKKEQFSMFMLYFESN